MSNIIKIYSLIKLLSQIRRQFLQIIIICLAAGELRLFTNTSCFAETIDPQAVSVHDPVIMEQDGWFYLFSTGAGIEMRRSRDLYDWQFIGRVFWQLPSWVTQEIPGVNHLWAPDVSYRNGRYYLYYSASIFGQNTSCIGLVSNVTLNPYDSNYQWVDEGRVIGSGTSNNYNTIDSNTFQDQDGQWWMAFGSFWSGIKLTELDASTGKPLADPPDLISLASRPSTAIEASFIVYRQGYYYLFVSFDQCCQGVDSTYKIMVGRSGSVAGPYVDRNGTAMLQGGGTLVLDADRRWKGPGHNAILQHQGQDYLVHHAYDAWFNGRSTLRIERLFWSVDGWPVVGEPVTQPSRVGTLAWWTFDEGSPGSIMADTLEGTDISIIAARDISGNGNDLLAWAPATAPSFSATGETPTGSGLSSVYDSDNRDIYSGSGNVAGHDLRVVTPDAWTVEASVYFFGLNGWQTFVGRDGYNVTPLDSKLAPLYFQKTSDHHFRIQFTAVDSRIYQANTTWTVQAGHWYHLAARSTAQALDLFVDQLDGHGYQLEASIPLTGTPALIRQNTGRPWTIGRGMFNNGITDFVNGRIDDVRISDRALDPSEFLYHIPGSLIIVQTDGTTRVSEQGETSDTYQIRLVLPPGTGPLVNPVDIYMVDNSQLRVEPDQLEFNASNWNQPQTVTITAIDDDVLEADPHETVLLHLIVSDDYRFSTLSPVELTVEITENECGAWGYLAADYNFDCFVDLFDYALLAVNWLNESSGSVPAPGNIQQLSQTAVDWLQTTLPYSPHAKNLIP